jgi:hypothetical protein
MSIPRSKRSGGPRTPVGKANSASNALKTGAYSNITVLPGESADEYRAIEQQLHKDFQPADLVEASMVREITSVIWKKLRLEKLENGAYLQLLSRPLTVEEIVHEYRGKRPAGNYREYLANASVYDKSHLNSLATEVIQVRKALAIDRASITEEVMYSKYPLLSDRLNNCISKSNGINTSGDGKIETHGKTFHLWDIQVSWSSSRNFLDWMLDEARHDIIGLDWVLSNRETIEAARHAAKEARLHKVLFADKSSRAFDDLNRAFFKMLAELRKHQEWRRRRPIDITPEPTAVS